MAIVNLSQQDLAAVKASKQKLYKYYSDLSLELGRPIYYFVHTYGCQLNESDSEKLIGTLEEMGLTEGNEENADIVIFNTCAIRENAEDKLFGNLGVFKSRKREDRNLMIIVCGCMMKVEENVNRIRNSFPYVDIVFDPQQIHNLPIFMSDKLNRRKQLIDIADEDYLVEDNLIAVKRARKFRALVPIMYGCNNFCTYCIVPYTRGRERSRDFDEIISELKDLANQGYKEVMLLGQNVNSYGKGDSFDKSFADLLRASAEIEGFSRVRFMTSHPRDLSDEVIDIMAEYKTLETHLHLPVQSGSDRILKEMNRHYTRDQYLRTAYKFRERIPEGSISTDIIVGFPGETEEDFLDTLSIVEEVKYDSAFTFQYSKRPGTKAASYPNQVPQEIVTERFGRLLELQNDNVSKSNMSKIGKIEEVLIEGESSTASDILTGRTRSNHLVNFSIPSDYSYNGKLISPSNPNSGSCASALEGKLCNVRITHSRPYSIDGIMENLIDG